WRGTGRRGGGVEWWEGRGGVSRLVRLEGLGESCEGGRRRLRIMAEPPVATPEEAVLSGKLVVLAIGNIHAGEVDGKEGLLMLARDLALAPSPRPGAPGERPLLKNLILLIAPIFNADGNEKIDKAHRTTQVGPTGG